MNSVRKINKIRKGQRRRARAFGANCLIKACVVSEVYACGGNGAALAHLNAGGTNGDRAKRYAYTYVAQTA